MLPKAKLETYATFKTIFVPNSYVMKTLSRSRSSFLAQLRFGGLSLEIETDRYTPSL